MADRATWDQLVQLQQESAPRQQDDHFWADLLQRGPISGDMLLGLPLVVTEVVTGLVLVTPVLPSIIATWTDDVAVSTESWEDAPVNTNVVHEQTQAINEEFGWENGDTAQEVVWDEVDERITCDGCRRQIEDDEPVVESDGNVFCFGCVDPEEE